MLAVAVVTTTGPAEWLNAAGAVPTSAATTLAHPHMISNVGATTVELNRAASVGFTYVDVSSKSVMDTLPAGTRGVYWVGNGYNSTCSWEVSDAALTATVRKNAGDPKFSGIYYVSDEPHTSVCRNAPTQLARRTALIHSRDPNARTYIAIEDGSNHPGEYAAFAKAADFIGVDAYPCNVNNVRTGCDTARLSARIDSALSHIPATRIVPIFQTFGQACASGGGNYYRLPTAAELASLLWVWDRKVPPAVRPFDDAYGWHHQSSACPTLADAYPGNPGGFPDLQSALSRYFAGMG